MYRMRVVLFTLYVTDLVGSTSTGNVRSRSPSRRLIFDANHKFTVPSPTLCVKKIVSIYKEDPHLCQGWASWEQYAACSTRCVSGYENETKQCCETGDNRLCYNLPWNILKMYVGTCPNATTTLESTTRYTTAATTTPTIAAITTSTTAATTTSTTAATTTSTTSVRTSTSTTARPTKATTTIQLPKTIPPITTTCAVCAGPKFICDVLYASAPCQPPNNYCINTITNYKDGTREVDRACGNFDTCYREWYLGSSDNDRCQQFDENFVQTLDFRCTYCCVTDNCNIRLHPSRNSLYNSLYNS